MRKRAFGPRSLVFGVPGPLRKRGAPHSFESGLGFSLPIPLCLIWSGGRGPLETVCAGAGGPPLARPPSLIVPCGDLGWGEATLRRALLGGSRHIMVRCGLRTVSWCTIGRGCENSTSSPGTYSAHVECGGKFSQVWPKRHHLSIWVRKRAPIARFLSISIPWGGPPVFQVASSQTWGRARPRGETLPPRASHIVLRWRRSICARSRLRPSSCGVESGKRKLGPKLHKSAI